MRDPRNPFLMRASEHIASDVTFLKLFAPGVFDLLPKDGLFEKLHFFQSAPGGGKTSLLRIFTPGSLLTLHAHRRNDDCEKLYKRMEDLEAVNESGPQILGVMLQFGRSYATLDDMELDTTRKDRLLLALLDSRIMLATLIGALTLKRLEYPKDLSKLKLELKPGLADHFNLPTLTSGEQLYQWAMQIETDICSTLDSLQPIQSQTLIGHDGLDIVNMLKPENISIDGVPVAQRVLIMLDDVHKLTRRQRKRLLSELIDQRNTSSIWVAERLEALGSSVLDPGSIHNRDYGEVVNLEEYWRHYPKRFESTVINIADRRALAAHDVEIESFTGCLQSSLDNTSLTSKFEEALEILSKRITDKYTSGRFIEWIQSRQTLDGTPRERLLAWKAVEILMERDQKKPQLEFDLPLSVGELQKRDDSDRRNDAELLLSQEFGLPYYYNFSTLAATASSNIEQFLAIAGELFEEAASAALVNKPHDLTPVRQHAILAKTAKYWWEEELTKRIPYPIEMRSLINAIGKLAFEETYQTNAPYSPGVTGIAINMREVRMLLDEEELEKRPDLKKLVKVLETCIAHNILEAMPDHSQGYQQWMVFYLNRLLCVQFRLTLKYGGWRRKKVKDLLFWIQDGFKPSSKNGARLL